MRRHSPLGLHFAFLLFGAYSGAMLSLHGCGGPDKQLRIALTSLDNTRDIFTKWDLAHQEAIVDDALAKGQSKEMVMERLRVYREKREKVVEFFQIAYSALAFAALDPSTVNLAEAASKAKDLYTAVKALMRGDP